MSRKRTTLKDLAKVLNVSPATVSRALHDSHEIGLDTKKAVWQLAKEMNYQPNQIAKRLLNKRSFIVGVIVPEISYYFNSEVIRGIEDVLLNKGYNIMICQTHEACEREVWHCENLVGNQVDGIISSVSRGTQKYDHFYDLQEKGVPLILFDRGGNVPNVSKVMVDNKAAAKEGVKHLIDIGCKRIAFLMGPPNLPIALTRLEGYMQALGEANIPFRPGLVRHCELSTSMGFSEASKLLEQQPDAVFAINDSVAIGVLAAIRHKGLKVPKDVAVLGFNDGPYSALISPSLTTVLQPAYKMGCTAAKMLLKQIKNPLRESQIEVLKTQLVVRASTVI